MDDRVRIDLEEFMPLLCCVFVLALFFCSIITVSAEDPFTKHSFETDNNQTLPYRQLSPETMTPGKRYPLVIFLHGSGQRGSDNDKQLKNVAPIFAEEANRKAFPCFVIVPQCPEGKRWCEVDWGDATPHKTPEQPSDPMKLLLKLIDQMRQQPNIDQSRLYVMGLSMGGFGTWDNPMT
jgi:predicted peptidase